MKYSVGKDDATDRKYNQDYTHRNFYYIIYNMCTYVFVEGVDIAHNNHPAGDVTRVFAVPGKVTVKIGDAGIQID